MLIVADAAKAAQAALGAVRLAVAAVLGLVALHFIRRRVPDPRDAEDILQDIFYELVEANRLLMPIEHVTGWLFRVARNRITDLFRKKKPEPFGDRLGAFERAGPDRAGSEVADEEGDEQDVDRTHAEHRDCHAAERGDEEA